MNPEFEKMVSEFTKTITREGMLKEKELIGKITELEGMIVKKLLQHAINQVSENKNQTPFVLTEKEYLEELEQYVQIAISLSNAIDGVIAVNCSSFAYILLNLVMNMASHDLLGNYAHAIRLVNEKMESLPTNQNPHGRIRSTNN